MDVEAGGSFFFLFFLFFSSLIFSPWSRKKLTLLNHLYRVSKKSKRYWSDARYPPAQADNPVIGVLDKSLLSRVVSTMCGRVLGWREWIEGLDLKEEKEQDKCYLKAGFGLRKGVHFYFLSWRKLVHVKRWFEKKKNKCRKIYVWYKKEKVWSKS